MIWDKRDRRRFVRARYPCKILVHHPQEHIISTHTEDISAGGIRVILKKELKVSSTVGLEIYLQDRPILCKGRVVWAVEKKPASEGDPVIFDIGVEFYEIKEEDRGAIDTFVKGMFFGGGR